MNNVYAAGAREAMTKIAKAAFMATKAVSVAAKGVKPKVPKPRARKPSSELGMGSPGIGTMDIGSVTMRRPQKLQQPPRPPRY